jgi:toxin ParE1/3/4
MIRLRWSNLALDDLASIRDYLLQRDPDAARRVIEAIRDRARLLKKHPMAGPPLDIGDTRKLTVPRYPYVIIYRVMKDEVVVTRVHHAAEDWRSRP